MSGDPLWYKDAVIYQLHVKAFSDSNGDGIGDFQGLTDRLDYLQDLGVTAIWLLPFYPSPLRDDGYDIADYTDVHPAYGTLRDFKTFLREAHRRELRVITELAINHTSDQHSWFQRARRARPGSAARDYYVWSDTPQRYAEARIIFKDFEPSNWTWDPLAGAYYWHRFYSHQPDLNFDNPDVRREILRVLDFWLAMGVDGMRLDAVPYLYEREGTNCENLPETHAFLKGLRAHVEARYSDRMLLAEANQWPEDAVAYFGDGDECHMAFHFPVMPRLYMALHMEDRFPIVDILQQTPAIPENSQWAIFLRNHDELTLEMVTDEDRDYMYRVYAQDQHARINLGIRRRLAPLLNHNRRRIEIMNSLLFSLPGTPVVYYGDEIGMGDNIYLGDRNGVRTPMQWSPDRNAGFSSGNPQQLYLPVIIDPEYHFESVNVESQQKNPHSLLWWMKRIFAMRKRFRAFSRGSIEFLSPENRKVLVFLRRWQDERILVVVNLSRFVQALELDLSPFRGLVPVEVFGRSALPPIGERPYFLTLGPHTFYWFTLEPERAVREPVAAGERAIPELSVGGGWMSALHDKGAEKLARILPAYLRERRWFASKARQILSAGILDTIELEFDGSTAAVTLVRVNYSEGDPDVYQLPLTFAGGEEGARVLRRQPGAVVARLRLSEGATTEGLLYDAAYNPAFGAALLDVIARRRRRNGEDGVIQGSRSRQFRSIRGPREERFEPQLLGSEQSNTSLCYGERMILKMFRRLDAGANPELEVGRFLTEQRFPAVPALAGAIEYVSGRSEPLTLAVLQAFVPNEGDAWGYTLDALHHYFDRVLARPVECRRTPPPKSKLLDLLEAPIPAVAEETIGGYLAFARLLGQRTAELHVALSSRPDDPAFAPEAISAMYRRSLYQYARSHCQRVLTLLRGRLDTLSGPVRDEALALLKASPQLNQRLHSVVDTKVDGMRIRCHGDYHLGQVMSTGKDFVIIDFEGEPARPISERRLKRSPLRDVAGMLRSFHYAASAALMDRRVRPEDVLVLRPCVDHWYLWVGATFVKAYMSIVQPRGLLPRGRAGLEALLDLCLLEKALYELAYELNHRPDWVGIPLRGIAALLEDTAQ